MQRSKEVHLLYRGASDKKDGGEPSRYLMQLEGSFHNEQGKPYLQLEHIRHQLPLPEVRPEVPDMAVTDKMRRRLAEWSSQGMSPSAINTMVQCPRNFAYRYLYQMGEPQRSKTPWKRAPLAAWCTGSWNMGCPRQKVTC